MRHEDVVAHDYTRLSRSAHSSLLWTCLFVFTPGKQLHTYTPAMASRFVENLDTVSTISHPHLNVSLEDILAEEGRKRSSSQSSESSQTAGRRSGSESVASPTSPTNENKMDTIRRRAFTLGSKKGRRAS